MSLGIVGACADGIVVASDGAMTECRLDGTYQRIREDAPKFWLLRDDVVLVAVGFADFVGRAVSEMQAFVGQHGDTPTLFYDAATFLATAIAGWYAASEAHAGAARPDRWYDRIRSRGPCATPSSLSRSQTGAMSPPCLSFRGAYPKAILAKR